jgi:hypothetical protein
VGKAKKPPTEGDLKENTTVASAKTTHVAGARRALGDTAKRRGIEPLCREAQIN